MPSKKQASYEYVLKIVKERLPIAEPAFVSMDFELAAKNAVDLVLENTVVKGCNFHFAQALWRRLQKHGHSLLYQTDKTFAFRCRHFLSLAFIPPNGKLNFYNF